MDDTTIEKEIQAKGLTAPRVTPADITAAISTFEFVKHVAIGGQVLRWCVITTPTGFAVTGRPSVAVSPENDDAAIGERVAYENAKQELWPLLGYALKEKLASTPADYRDRVRAEAAELTERMVKLEAFFKTDTCAQLPQGEQANLQAQYEGMAIYRRALHARIAAFN